MRTFDLLVPCHFGLEAVLKREIYDLGYEITKVEDGRVTFEGVIVIYVTLVRYIIFRV